MSTELSRELFELLKKRKYSPENLARLASLLDEGADANYTDENETCLSRAIACWNNDQRMRAVAMLIDAGADVNQPFDGNYPIARAVRQKHQSLVELLLAKGANEGLSDALKEALEGDSAHMARALIENGANANLHEQYHEPMLVYCVEAYRVRKQDENYDVHPGLATAKLLLDLGANPDGPADARTTPLSSAVGADFPELAELLLDKGAAVSNELNNAQSIEMAELLLKNGADVDAKNADHKDYTPLIAAVQNKNRELIQFFLDQGCDVHAADRENLTAFHHAVFHEDPEFIAWLLPSFDLNRCNEIHPLAELSDEPAIKKLLVNG